MKKGILLVGISFLGILSCEYISFEAREIDSEIPKYQQSSTFQTSTI